MTTDEFFVSYRVHSGIYNTTATGFENQYFSGLWVQRENGFPISYYPPVLCDTLYDQEDVSKMFWNDITGMYCPDMNNGGVLGNGTVAKNATAMVQNFSNANPGNNSYDFFFVLDTCSHLAT